LDDYTCTCDAGFEGKECEINHNDCASEAACSNHGTCIDAVDAYSCNCDDGFTGTICDIVVEVENVGTATQFPLDDGQDPWELDNPDASEQIDSGSDTSPTSEVCSAPVIVMAFLFCIWLVLAFF